jgi:outer membrane protein TolC
MIKKNSFSFGKAPLLAGVLFSTLSYGQELQNNIELSSSKAKIESLNEEMKIVKSLFLPQLSLETGIGSEKLKDNDFETDKGPYGFLLGKLNLYRGGKDSIQLQQNEVKIDIAKLEKEIKTRNLNIEVVKKISSIELINKKNQLIENELKDSKTQQGMAKKKVDAGLTTSVDLLDFELKKNRLTNEMDKNNLEKEELQRELVNLNGGAEIQRTLEEISLSTELNYEKSPSFILAKKQIELSLLDKNEVKAEYLPSVDLEAKWGQLTPQSKFFGADKEHQVALNISIPLFSGLSTEKKMQQAVLESTQRTREARQAELEANSKYDIAQKKIELIKKTITILERSLSQAQKYKDLTIGEYKRGVKNSPDVISASDKKFELEQKLLEAKNELYNVSIALNETFKKYDSY